MSKTNPKFAVGNVVTIKNYEGPVRIDEVLVTVSGVIYEGHAWFDERYKGTFAEQQIIDHYLGAL